MVIQELLRLLTIYTQSRSFINYASALLWITVYLSTEYDTISDELLRRVVKSTTRWKESVFRYCLGYYCRRNISLPFDIVYAIADQDERSINSVVTRRHEEKFRELFVGRFSKAYPGGFTLRPGSRERKIDYQPASGTLLASKHLARELTARTIPDVLSARGQFSPLVAIWNECIEELKEFDRASRRAVSATMTGEMYEALPAELRLGDHPESAAWQRTITESVNEGGWPIMPVSRLAEIKGLAARPQLTKKQSQSLLATADSMGFAIEPDVRLMNRNYRWDEPIVVFRNEGVVPSDAQSKAYHSAAILLRLGLSIAQADGQLDEVELTRIAEHIEQEFNLGQRLAKRLDALTHLLAVERVSEITVGRTLQKALSLEQRRLVGQFLLAIAAVDELVCPDERKVLRKAYRALGIPVEELDALLASHEKPPGVTEHPRVHDDDALPPPALNLERIRAIHAETARVQSLLHEVLSNVDVQPDDEEVSVVAESNLLHVPLIPVVDPSAHAISLDPSDRPRDNSHLDQTPGGPLARLPERYREFYETVISRDRWHRDEIANLARAQGLMLNAALEVLNEWSTEVYGDWLTEEYDAELIVRKQVIGVTSNA